MPKVKKDKEAMQQRGNILTNLRKARNINQSYIANVLGVTQQAYVKYEHGEADPTIDALIKLSKFYNTSTDSLLGLEKPAKPDILTMLTQEFHLTDLEKALVQAYIAISPKEREKFIQSIEETVKQKEESQQQAPKSEPPIVQSIPQNPPQLVKPPIVQQSNPPKPVEPPSKPDIQISQMRNSEFAIARGGNGMYKPLPTDEQMESFEEVTPDMI